MFLFVSAEKIGELRPKGQVTVTVPTELERQGNFSQSGSNAKPIAAGGAAVTIKDPTTGTPFPGNIIPANRIVPSMQNYLNLFPLPNYTSAADLAQLNTAFDQSHTAVKDRKIIDFPAAATDRKMVFLPVKPTGLSAIPIWNGAADPQTLWFVGIGLCFILPIVLSYQFHAYWVFRGKTRVETSADDRDASPHIWARHTSGQHKGLHLS